ncbi:MAG: hypothetical protein QOH06_5446 [Acidobacteriota bacterium]|jgi:SAM-dependent methyltransferase|nr:hypothetical protein [Acidobacteriota bacterium]
MELAYWERFAAKGEYFFDTLKGDRNGIIIDSVKQLSSVDLIAGDFGCGPGRYLPLLSRSFSTVYAVDFCKDFLAAAQEAATRLQNIIFIEADLADPQARLQKVNVALCVNVLLAPSLPKINSMLNVIWRALHRGGHLLLVVPSLESVLYTRFRLREWTWRNASLGSSQRSLMPNQRFSASICDGVVKRGTAPTKHYLREELLVLLKGAGFDVLSINKVEYPWSTEFYDPPRKLRDPYPWDWLLICQRK